MDFVSLGPLKELDALRRDHAKDKIRESQDANGQLGIGRDNGGCWRVDHRQCRDCIKDGGFRRKYAFGVHNDLVLFFC